MLSLKRALAGLAVLVAVGTALAAQDVSLGGKKAKTPSGWKEEAPANQMRYAQFKLPKVDGDDADAELVVFKGLGGSADANIDRWKGSFAKGVDAKITEYSGPLGKGKMIDAKGTYLYKSQPFNPNAKAEDKPGYSMLGLHVEGDAVYHIRLTGPTKTVSKHREAFEGWLKSFQ
jgi:hypothetical protein